MVKYTLNVPITFGDETITELEFIQPKLKHLKKLDGVTGDIAKTAKMIEVCCNVPPSVVDEIDISDIQKIAEVVEGFF